MFGALRHIPKIEARAALLSLFMGIAILATKYIAYFLTQSAAIFSDATESIANVLASSVALYSLIVAHRPADKLHPYGHGKIEFVSAWFEAAMIIAAAVFIVAKTGEAMYYGNYARADTAGIGIVLIALTIIANGAVGATLLFIGRRQNSLVLIADGRHLLTDVVTSAGVLIALGLVKFTGIRIIDPIAALLVAAYITWTGVQLLRHATGGIMDKQDIEDDRVITLILDSHCGSTGKEPRICNYHKLRHRHSGRYHWVDFHIRLPGHCDVYQAHEIASSIEMEIEAALGEGNATAHVEPCDLRQCEPQGVCGIVPDYSKSDIRRVPPAAPDNA